MAKARALDKRRKSIRNIRKITRTMELIATAKFKKAMDRATAASAYTRRLAQLVGDLAESGCQVDHPLLQGRAETKAATVLVLSANRGLCGGYNSNIIRNGMARLAELNEQGVRTSAEVSGKRGLAAFKFRKMEVAQQFTQFDDQPAYDEVEQIANRYLEAYAAGQLDRLDVAYMKFVSMSKQETVVETLLPLGSIGAGGAADEKKNAGDSMYEFFPSAESILREVVPASFRMRLFKCFLDAAVSEQIARMVAMKSATENASEMIKQLSQTYNRARQSQITGEIMEIIGGVEALNG